MAFKKPKKNKLLSIKGSAGKRRSRVKLNLPLQNKRFSPSIRGNIVNLSDQGAFIATVPEREGRIIDLEFSFPGQKDPFVITSRVYWNRKPAKFISQSQQKRKNQDKGPVGMGVRFLRFLRGTPDELKSQLADYSQHHAPPQESEHLRLLKEPQAELPHFEIQTMIQASFHLKDDEIDGILDDFWDGLII